MAIPATKVRLLCNSTEADLVRSSRRPGIAQLSQAEVKRLAVRARKLSDKWQGLVRGQSRVQSQNVGFGDAAANTQLKADIFREALDSLEARLAQMDAAEKKKAPTKKLPPKKKQRAAEHRATRATVRKVLSVTEEMVNRKPSKKKKK